MQMYNHLLYPSSAVPSSIQVGAKNLRIQCLAKEGYTVLDISGATVKQIVIKKPDNTILTKNGTFLTDGTDGILYYMTETSDIDQPGTYYVQMYFELDDGFEGYSSLDDFVVVANL